MNQLDSALKIGNQLKWKVNREYSLLEIDVW